MPTEKPARASGVSAAEKYAELEARGEDRPRCQLHGKEKGWRKDYRLAAGGWWRCWRCSVSNEGYYAAHREERLAYAAKKRSDPDFRRRMTLYQFEYYYRRKHERWADQGLTLRNNGEEGSPRGDRTAA